MLRGRVYLIQGFGLLPWYQETGFHSNHPSLFKLTLKNFEVKFKLMKHAVKSLKLLTSQADACLIPSRRFQMKPSKEPIKKTPQTLSHVLYVLSR